MQQGILDKEPPTGDGQIPDSATHKPSWGQGPAQTLSFPPAPNTTENQ